MFKRVIYAESSPLLWERNQGKAKSDFSPFFLRRANLCGVFKEKLEQFVACAVNFKAVCACRC